MTETDRNSVRSAVFEVYPDRREGSLRLDNAFRADAPTGTSPINLMLYPPSVVVPRLLHAVEKWRDLGFAWSQTATRVPGRIWMVSG
jgi:hypothetical protein